MHLLDCWALFRERGAVMSRPGIEPIFMALIEPFTIWIVVIGIERKH